MRHAARFCSLVLLGLLAYASAQERAPENFQRVATTELQPLAGSWELPVDPKSGWKGAVKIRIGVREGEPRDKTPKDGALHFDFRLEGDGVKTENLVVETSAAPLHFAVLRKGKTRYLVVVDDPYNAPKIDPSDAKKAAPFDLMGDRLSIDMSKSYGSFVPPLTGELPLPWKKLVWTRVKEK